MVTLRGSSSTCAAIHANGRSRTPRCSTANGAQTAPSCSCPRSRSSGSFRRRSRNSRRGSGPRASASTKALENARQAQAVMATAAGQASSKCVRSHAAERCAHRTPARIRCARFYTAHPYPPPVANLDRAREEWQDTNRHRAEHYLFWPGRPYRAELDILVAGCGTWQAATYALCRPHACVVASESIVASTSSTGSDGSTSTPPARTAACGEQKVDADHRAPVTDRQTAAGFVPHR
jgi:hypothetical protein